MNILHVYKTFLNDSFGGIEQTIYQMAKANSSTFKHTVLSVSKDRHGSDLTYDGIQHLCYKQDLSIASTGFSLSLLRDFRHIAEKADLIHYHFPWPFADILHLFRGFKKPAIVTYHSDIIRQQQLLILYRPLMARFLNSVDKIIATSPNYAASSPVLQKYKDKVATIPIGLDKDNFPATTNEQRTYWQGRFGSRFFLFVGVMRYYKGLHVLLDAIQNTDFPVLIIGTGPLENELKAQAERLNLTNAHFLGRLSDTDKAVLLELCLSVIFPSHLRSEAFGITLVEGAMAGKPLISAEIGTGTSYINVDGETGFVVPPSDSRALRQAMQFLWDNPDRAAAMGACAAERYNSLFTRDKMVAEYEKIYHEVLNKNVSSKIGLCADTNISY